MRRNFLPLPLTVLTAASIITSFVVEVTSNSSTTTTSTNLSNTTTTCDFTDCFKKNLGVSIGVGVAGLTVVVVFVAIVSVCCDRKCHKRYPTTSTLCPRETDEKAKKSVELGERNSDHTYYNDAATLVGGNQKTGSGGGMGKETPGDGRISAVSKDDGAYAEVSEIARFQSNSKDLSSVNEISDYDDTAAIKRNTRTSHHATTGEYEEAVVRNPIKSNENFADGSPTALSEDTADQVQEPALDEDIDEQRGQSPMDDDITVVDNTLYIDSSAIHGPVGRFDA